MKLYNFQPDEKTQKPQGTIEYEILKAADNSKVLDFSENVSELDGSASQMTIEKLLPLQTLQPGQYILRLKVTDSLRNQTLTQSAPFAIT
jgi:5-hydroxyisourate hydrolase-like protein (transthyretin family)